MYDEWQIKSYGSPLLLLFYNGAVVLNDGDIFYILEKIQVERYVKKLMVL